MKRKNNQLEKETFVKDGDNLLKVSCSEILDKLLQQCLTKYFPELVGVGIKIGYVVRADKWGGTKAKEWVILFLPENIPLTSLGLKWIVVHELCHFLNLHNPDEIFKNKVPKEVWKMWQKLEKDKELKCDKGEK